MKDIKMQFSDEGIYPIDKKDMFFARNDMHEYYKEVAKIICQPNSNILEIGFGMGISSNEISNLNPKSHTIIEINDDIYQNAVKWSLNRPNTSIILGNWYDIIPTLLNTYDGIFIDTIEDGNIWEFERFAKMVSKVNTVLCAVHYERIKNSGLYYKKINGHILNWSVYDGKRFCTKTNKNRLI
jgi:hypothetical protein